MTDYDKLTELLKQFNVSYKIIVDEETNEHYIYLGDFYVRRGVDVYQEYEGDEDKVKSYCGFYTYYCFDSNKKFKSIGIYE